MLIQFRHNTYYKQKNPLCEIPILKYFSIFHELLSTFLTIDNSSPQILCVSTAIVLLQYGKILIIISYWKWSPDPANRRFSQKKRKLRV